MNKNKRAFTLIEIIVTIAVLGILVLIGSPKLIGYLEKAELARIQHDVKVMEQEIEIALMESESNFASWDDNGKDLGKLILSDKLYDREGFAKKVEKSHLARYYESQQGELGTGGELYPISAMAEHNDSEVDLMTSFGYKIIPAQYSSKINTELKGTFYASPDGKVYYEHGKTLVSQKDELIKACDAPVAEDLGYTFEVIDGKGTITKYDHREQHIVIPSEFKIEVDGEEICEPVRVIGKAAFAYGPLKKLKLESVVIPGSVEIIEEDAFKDNNIPKITIPSSVKVVKDNILVGNNVSHIIIRGESGSSPIKEINYPGVNIEYNYGTPKDLDIIFDYNSGTIIDYYGTGGKYIEVPKFVTQNGINYPVKVIAKGAYQGLGLISVILPETLERIEDYAFSGNQLTGITIPNSVVHIGNYAFSFNEKTHSHSGEKIATMKTVIMQNIEQINKIDKMGDILESSGGLKVNLLGGKLALLDHIFVTSIGNKVEIIDDEESLPGEPEGSDTPVGGQDGPIVFDGLGPEAYDGDDETYIAWDGTKELTWTGNLDNKELLFKIYTYANTSTYQFTVRFYDKDGNILKSPTTPESTSTRIVSPRTIGDVKVIVPAGAVRMDILSNDDYNKIYEISAPINISTVNSQNVSTTPEESEISMSWETKQRTVIIRDNIKISDSITDIFVDKPLQPNTVYNYEIIFFDEYGNGSEVIKMQDKTKNRSVVFKGLEPEAWDGDNTTAAKGYKGAKTITWIGDLDNKELLFKIYTYANTSTYQFTVRFYDKDGNILKSPSTPESTSTRIVSPRTIGDVKVIVPVGAVRMDILSNDNYNKIYEISAPTNISTVNSQKVYATPGDSNMSLTWGEKQRTIIIRDNIKISDSITDSFIDKPLQPNTVYNYEIIFFDEYGNGSEVVKMQDKTKNRSVVFKGLEPEAWDGDNATAAKGYKGNKTITWIGDLDNKELLFKIYTYANTSTYQFTVRFYDKDGNILKSPSTPESTSTRIVSPRTIGDVKVIVPAGAVRMDILSNDNYNKIYEISVPGNMVID